MRVYLTEVSRVPPLNRAEEITCIEHARAEDEMAESCRKRLVEANLRLVITLAERHQNEGIEILELVQKGNQGLLQAARNLTDCAPGSFSTHATKFIERAIINARKTGPTNL